MAFSASAQYKPEPHGKVKARAEREHARERALCRARVYADAGGCCQRCGKGLYLHPNTDGADWYNTANINEIVPRSLGGSDTDPANCNCLCADCHTGQGYHDHG